MDLDLLGALAAARPDWSFVMIGPVVKIDPDEPAAPPNIHWLGGKTYAELPRYLAGWDVGFMPFARNEATRFISPTKTPEFLAAGKPVVSTPIPDVVRALRRPGAGRDRRDAGAFVRRARRSLDAAARALAAAVDRAWRRLPGTAPGRRWTA